LEKIPKEVRKKYDKEAIDKINKIMRNASAPSIIAKKGSFLTVEIEKLFRELDEKKIKDEVVDAIYQAYLKPLDDLITYSLGHTIQAMKHSVDALESKHTEIRIAADDKVRKGLISSLPSMSVKYIVRIIATSVAALLVPAIILLFQAKSKISSVPEKFKEQLQKCHEHLEKKKMHLVDLLQGAQEEFWKIIQMRKEGKRVTQPNMTLLNLMKQAFEEIEDECQ